MCKSNCPATTLFAAEPCACCRSASSDHHLFWKPKCLRPRSLSGRPETRRPPVRGGGKDEPTSRRGSVVDYSSILPPQVCVSILLLLFFSRTAISISTAPTFLQPNTRVPREEKNWARRAGKGGYIPLVVPFPCPCDRPALLSPFVNQLRSPPSQARALAEDPYFYAVGIANFQIPTCA